MAHHGGTALGLQRRVGMVEVGRRRRPDQSHDALHDHRAVEDVAPLFLIGHAPRHQGRLRGVESRHRAARDADEHHREYGVGGRLRMTVLQTAPDFGDFGLVDGERHHDAHGHAHQQETEYRIDPANDLVDRQQGGYQVVSQDDDHPDVNARVGGELRLQQLRGRVHEDHPDEHHQQHHETAHELFHAVAEVFAVRLGQTAAVVAQGNHARQVVVDRAAEDAPEDNPQVGGRAELCPHDGAADRTHPRDVQELDEEKLPRLHRNVIDPVGHRLRRRRPLLVNAEHPVHETAVEKVSEDEQY